MAYSTFAKSCGLWTFGASRRSEFTLPVMLKTAANLVPGSLATWYQSSYLGAYIPAGSMFAMFQKWGMTLVV